MKKLIGKLTRTSSAVLCLSGLLVNDIRAQQAWDPNGTTSIGGSGFTWDNSTKNWTPNNTQTQVAAASLVAWTAGNQALFCAGPSSSVNQGTFTDSVSGTVVIAGIVCGSDNPGACNITLNGPGSLSINNAISTLLMGGTGGSTETLNCTITGASGKVLNIQNSSSSTTSLFGNNTYVGGTWINGSGAINYNNNASFGTGTITWLTGGFLQPSGATAINIPNAVTHTNVTETFAGNSGGITFSGAQSLQSLSGTVTLSDAVNAAPITIAGPITGSTALLLRVASPGTGWVLTGTNTFTGAFTVSNATTVVVGGSGSLGSGSYAANVTDSGKFVFNTSSNQTLSGIVSGVGTLTQEGSGKLVLSGVNTFSGGVSNSGVLVITNSGSVASANVITNNGIFIYNSSASQTLSGIISGGGSVTEAGSGTLTLTGNNTFSGDVTNSGGAISINGSTVTPFGSGAGTINLNGGNIIVSADRGTSANNITNPISLNANSQFQSAGTTGIRNLVFGGLFNTTAGTLTIHETGTGAGLALFNVRFTNTFTFSQPITFLVDNTGHTINLDIWNRSDLGDQTYSGVISGPGGIRRSVTTANTGGRVIFTGINTYTGGTSLNDGEIALGSDCAGSPDSPTSGPLGVGTITVSNDVGRLSAFTTARNLFNHILFNSSGKHLTMMGANDLTLSGNLDLGGQSVVFTNSNTGVSTIAGTINNGSFVFQGPNALTLAGTNTYSGATTISASTLALAATGSIAGSSSVSIAAGTTFDVSAISAYAFGSTTLSASGNASAATIKGASGGTVDLGSSAITLSYDGSDPSLVISQGTLNLNGNAFVVNGSALAAGNYTIVSQSSGSITSAGSFPVTGTVIGAGKSGSISVSGGNVVLTISTIPTFSGLTASPSVTYGTSSISLSGTVSATGPIYPANGDPVSVSINGHVVGGTISDTTGDFSITYNDPSLALAGVGGSPYTITYSYPGNPAVLVGPKNDTSTALTVTAASLSVTASNQSKTYGQTVTTIGSTAFSSLGLLNGETIGSVALSISGGGAASSAPVSGSPYTITPSSAAGGTFNANNYAIAYNTGTLTVNPATLTVTADNLSRAFGAVNPSLTATYTNFVNGETLGTSDVIGSPALTTGADTNSDIGSYTITNNTGTLASTNYTFSLVNGTLTVTNALSTNVVTADVNPALPATTVTLTSTLSAIAPSLAVPSGTVQFLTNGTAYGSPVTLTNGAAAIAVSTLAHGSNTIEADFAGTTNLSGGTNIVGSTNTLSVLINTPPVAGTANYQRPAGTPLTIKISDLLTNATDADGDTLSLASVSATSTNGATIMNDGTFLHYLPPGTNGDVTDTFLYSVSDTFGATNQATVVVSILSNNGPSVNITGMTTLPNGTFLISFAGIPNRSYLIQATTNLTPTIIWTTLSTNTAGTNGLFQYNDTDSTNFPTRYYRTATP